MPKNAGQEKLVSRSNGKKTRVKRLTGKITDKNDITRIDNVILVR